MRRADLVSKVRCTVDEYGLLTEETKVLVAVSGGPDSICLLSVLRRMSDERSISIHIAHFNHALRGAESDEDARWVASMALSLGIPVTVGRAGPGESHLSPWSSSEERLRLVRHRFLSEIAETVGASRIATGHTLNDQAETLLLRLARGTGLSGMGGILPKSGRLIRPLLRVTRGEVMSYLESEGLEYREDRTNRELDHARNRVRMKVIPALEKYCNPKIVELLGRYAELAQADDSYLDALAETELEKLLVRQGAKEMVLNRDGLLALDSALTRRVLRRALWRIAGSLKGITLDHILSSIELKTGKRLHLPSGLVVSREYGRLILSTCERTSEAFDYRLEVPGRVVVRESDVVLLADVVDDIHGQEKICDPTGNVAYFDVEGIELPLTVRGRRPGDRMRPFGMEGERKVKDILIDDKVPRTERDSIPVVVDQRGVLWLVGSRRSDRAPVASATKRVLRIRADRFVTRENP